MDHADPGLEGCSKQIQHPVRRQDDRTLTKAVYTKFRTPSFTDSGIKLLRAGGLIDIRPLNGKHIEYRLTEAGSNLASSRLEQFCAELVRIYTSLKESIRGRLREGLPAGARTVALFGAAETCEVTLAVLKDMDLFVMAIVDNDPAKQGQAFHDHVVDSPETLARVSCDAVIITSYAAHQEIRRQIDPLLAPRGIRVCTL